MAIEIDATLERMQRQADLKAFRAELRAAGYQYGPTPSSLSQAEAFAIDRQGVESSTCETCGAGGQWYEGWTKRGSYRALMICPTCKAFVEF